MDREYTIKHLPNRLEGTILIQPNYIINHKDKSIDIVVKNKETYVFLAIYQKHFDSHRTEMNDGGLPRVLGTQGWEQLTNPNWFIEWVDPAFFCKIKKDDYCKTQDPVSLRLTIWGKLFTSGQGNLVHTISVMPVEDHLSFAIFIAQGNKVHRVIKLYTC